MQLNEHQLRLWNYMLESISDFRKGKIGYFEFVGALEGALDAGEFQDKDIIEQWYKYWTPLEVLRATKENDVIPENIKTEIFNMESFLKSVLVKSQPSIK